MIFLSRRCPFRAVVHSFFTKPAQQLSWLSVAGARSFLLVHRLERPKCYWLESDPEEIAEVAIEILSPHQGKIYCFVRPCSLTADRFLDHFMQPNTVDKPKGVCQCRLPECANGAMVGLNFIDQGLEHAVRASSHLPSLRFRSVLFRGERCVDGGFTELPRHNPKHADGFSFGIDRDGCPSSHLDSFWHSVIVPSPLVARRLYARGKQDMHAKLERLLNGKRLPLRRAAL